MNNFVDMTNDIFDQEYDNWEEYLSDDEFEVDPPTPTPPLIKKESEQEKQARILQHLSDISKMSGYLTWKEKEENKLEESDLDDKEFPVLGSKVSTKKSAKISRLFPDTNTRKLVIMGKSYEEKVHDKQKFNEFKRSEAFNLLADKNVLNKKLEKTRMCNSIEKNEKCQHGAKCRFAHSLDELNISKCFFGDGCRYIKNLGGKVVNNGKLCPHRHPNETTDEFYNRTNLIRFKKTNTKVLDLTSVVKKAEDFIEHSKIIESSKPKPVVSETVLRVPPELAVQAMELAIKGGKRSVRVEIIN